MVQYRRVVPLAAALFVSACGQQQQQAGEKPMTIEERGRAAFAACAVCHSVKDPTAPGYASQVGPSLFAVYGASSAHVAGFDYSQAMRQANLTWDDATLDAFIANPHQVIPKTRMAFAGEPDADKRAALIAYLKTLK
jgi:cytochrome c